MFWLSAGWKLRSLAVFPRATELNTGCLRLPAPAKVCVNQLILEQWPKPAITSKNELGNCNTVKNMFEDRNCYFTHSGTKFSKKSF